MGSLDKMLESVVVGTMTLESIASVFENLQSKHQILIRVFQVLAQSPYDVLKYQMRIRVFQGLKPLQHPLHGLEVMPLWKRLLQENKPYNYGIYAKVELASSTPYTQLFSEVILQFLAYAILSPWKTIFNPASQEQLIFHFIVLNLMIVLQEFVINPTNQQLDPFNWLWLVSF